VEKNIQLRQCRIIGHKNGCFDNREKKNGCEKTSLKKIRNWNNIKKRIRVRKLRTIGGKREGRVENREEPLDKNGYQWILIRDAV
jgi:hypothetical protein